MAGRGNRGRGRGRGRERVREETSAEETSQHSPTPENSKDEDFVPSPAFSRYTRRNSRGILDLSATLPYSLRKPVRNVMRATRHSSRTNPRIESSESKPRRYTLRNGDSAMPELQGCTSKHPPEDLISYGPAASSRYSSPHKNVSPDPIDVADLTSTRKDKTISSGSEDETELDKIFEEFTEQYQGVQPVAPVAVQDQDPLTSNQPLKEKCTVDRNSQCSSRCQSINVTEFAKILHDDMEDDPEEVESVLEPGFEFAHGHKVKAEVAPLVRRIFEKHGDITSETDLKSSNSLSHFLQQVCHVYGQLEKMKFREVTHLELNNMLADVRDCERMKINVGWLREKLEYVSETWRGFQEYWSLKQEDGENDVFIGWLEKKLEAYKTQISALEDELAARRAKADRIKNTVVDIKNRVRSLEKQSLVDGLL